MRAQDLNKRLLRIALLFNLTVMPIASRAESDELRLLYEMAESGSKVSLYTLGVKHGNGDGVKLDHEIANQYYFRAAKMNYAPAQNNLGWALRQGIGVKKDPKRALFWFRLAALQSNPLALQNLAEMYQDGEGVKRGSEVAEELYLLCATQPMADLENQGGRESGSNNAIHECRKEVAKSQLLKQGDTQTNLRRAALWLTIALGDDVDIADDSDTGVKARKSVKETEEMLTAVHKKLAPESIVWVKKTLASWASYREIILDQTPFPLTLMEFESEAGRL